MKRIVALLLLIGLGICLIPFPAGACSCNWRGPFLSVAREAPLVIRGRILRHSPGKAPTMDVLVLETLSGGLLDGGLVVQMGDGMHCRPILEAFPAGSEWVLALNGPGAKPGRGLALSHCGEFSLRLENGEVIGSIDGKQGQVKRMPWREFKERFLYPHFRKEFRGCVRAGERFRQAFGSRFEFVLEPTPTGWEVVVREYGREDNLARLTPPLHFVPNPREIEGWHLADDPAACTSRPYAAQAGPGNPRNFIFSPDVGTRIGAAETGRSVTVEDIEKVSRFGRGVLTVESFVLKPGNNGCPTIEEMKFSVLLEGGY